VLALDNDATDVPIECNELAVVRLLSEIAGPLPDPLTLADESVRYGRTNWQLSPYIATVPPIDSIRCLTATLHHDPS